MRIYCEMDKILRLLLPLLSCCIIIACSKSNVSFIETKLDVAMLKQTHFISREEALKSLDSFLSSTKTKTHKEIDSVYSVISWKTKSEVTSDTLLYIVNYKHNNGYAILSADDRIGSEVISYVENGNIAIDSLKYAGPARRIDNSFPLYGDGIFAVDEYPGELFLNPNTFDLYDSKEDDFYVGDYNYEDSLDISIGLQNMIVGMCVNYAVSEINNYAIVPDSSFFRPGHLPNYKIQKKEIVTLHQSDIFLKDEVKWSQRAPFNDLFPLVRKYVLFGERKKAYTGCFPLAMAKIVAYQEDPQIYTVNGYTIDWKELKDNFNSPVGSKSASVLLFDIGKECKSLCFYQGTFTFPNGCVDYLSSIGYKSVKLSDYRTEIVTNMIDHYGPIAICSVPKKDWYNYDLAKSHAWNIDGYRVNQTIVTNEVYRKGKLYSSTQIKKDPVVLVHCDWGWRGIDNGYFVSGIFDLSNRDDIIFDGPTSSVNTNYNFFLKVIEYEVQKF